MTDRGRTALKLTSNTMTVGPSQMHWKAGSLIIDIDEMGAPPMIAPVRGQVRLSPTALTNVELPLSPDAAHIWRPFAPTALIEVDLAAKGWQWHGHGYFDANFGTRALEEDFSYWTWGRFPTKDGSTCFYDAQRLDGTSLSKAIRFDANGTAQTAPLPPKATLKRSLWTVRRETRADQGYRPRQVMNMLDAPFYSRAMVRTKLEDEETTGVYEALDLRRFRSPLLKPMLAVRVPRRAGWTF